jgi:hypothetical protein
MLHLQMQFLWLHSLEETHLLLLIILCWVGCMLWLFIIMHFMCKFNYEFLEKSFALRLIKDEEIILFWLTKATKSLSHTYRSVLLWWINMQYAVSCFNVQVFIIGVLIIYRYGYVKCSGILMKCELIYKYLEDFFLRHL